ncbi:MAG: GldG family protein [Clostridia bacterium]|nr:GldG family protein [Clostridia bacterium]
MKDLFQKSKMNLIFGLLAALLLIGVFLLNGIAFLLSSRHSLHIDLTANAAYKIGEDTAAALTLLQEPVEVFVLSAEEAFGGSNYLNQAKRVLLEYPRHSDKVHLTFVDYASNPSFAVGFPDLALSHGDLIVRSGSRVKHIKMNNLFHYAYTSAGGLTIESSRAEEALTSAILNVTGDELPKIAVLTGNGVFESKLFTALLADNNYELATVNLATESLDGFDAALLLTPTIDLSENALRKLEGFLYNNGAYGKVLLYAAGVTQGAMPNLDAFLAEWGLAFQNGAVFETKAERTYQFQPYYPVADYVDGRYKSMLRDANMPFLMPLARPMGLLFTAKDGFYVETLLAFGQSSGVRPADAGEDFAPERAETTGPMPALALSGFYPAGLTVRSCIVAAASAGMLEPVALHNASLANSEYLLALFADLLGKDALITIQPKSLAGKTLGVTSAQVTRLGVLLAGVLPLLILGAGMAVWLLRRYK